MTVDEFVPACISKLSAHFASFFRSCRYNLVLEIDGSPSSKLSVVETNMFKHTKHIVLSFTVNDTTSINEYLVARLHQSKSALESTAIELALEKQALFALSAQRDLDAAEHQLTIKKMEGEAKALKDSFDLSEAQINLQHELELMKLQNEVSFEKDAKEKFVLRIQELENTLHSKDLRIHELEKVEKAFSSQEERIIDLQSSNFTLFQEVEKLVSLLQTSSVERSKISDAEVKYAQLLEENQHLNDSMKEYSSIIEKYEEKITSSIQEISSSNQLIKSIQEESSQSKEKMKQMKANYKSLLSQSKDLEKKIEFLNSTVSSLQTELTHERLSLLHTRETVGALGVQLDRAKEDLIMKDSIISKLQGITPQGVTSPLLVRVAGVDSEPPMYSPATPTTVLMSAGKYQPQEAQYEEDVDDNLTISYGELSMCEETPISQDEVINAKKIESGSVILKLNDVLFEEKENSIEEFDVPVPKNAQTLPPKEPTPILDDISSEFNVSILSEQKLPLSSSAIPSASPYPNHIISPRRNV
jgi:myosin heavy subunit